MPCYYPLTGYRSKITNAKTRKRGIVFNQSDGFKDMPVQLPCGHCIGCKLERSRQWAIRCMHEAQLHRHNMFLTLTYSPENLPKHGTLVKSHFQDFMKDYRFWLDYHSGEKIRFFQCGEYGEKGDRPHYHALIFGHDFKDKKPHAKINGNILYKSAKLEELWTHGFCLIGNVTFESAAYVSRYVTKKISGEKALHHYNKINIETGEVLEERIPEYVTMSRRPGIGNLWFEKYTMDVFPSDEIVLRGRKMKVPKYYSSLFERIHESEFQHIKRKRIALAKLPAFAQHNTYERLRVREAVQLANFKLLKRNLEK